MSTPDYRFYKSTNSHFRWNFILYGLTVLGMAGFSLASLLAPQVVYPHEGLRQAFLANDIVNLVIGVPIALVSLFLAQRGKLSGVLFLPGALLFTFYNYTAYLIAFGFAWQSWFYAALSLLSGYCVFRLLHNLDLQVIHQRLIHRVPERFAGSVLTVLGTLFFLRGMGQAVSGALMPTELGVVIADLLTTPLWIIGGVLLWRKRPLGYAAGAGLLFQASMLFVGLLVFFILQPLVTGLAFAMTDFIVVFLMGWVVFAPFGLFLRGILRAGQGL